MSTPFRVAIPNRVMKPTSEATVNTPPMANTAARPRPSQKPPPMATGTSTLSTSKGPTTLVAFLSALYALHVDDKTQNVAGTVYAGDAAAVPLAGLLR